MYQTRLDMGRSSSIHYDNKNDNEYNCAANKAL